MRVTFVALGWEQLGVSLLSALAKRDGHEVNLAFSVSQFNDRYNFSIPSLAPIFDDRSELIKTIIHQKPDVLAFSVLTGTYQWMLGVAEEIKAVYPEVKTIFGGVHVSAVPDRVLSNSQVDYVCVGEGDVAFPTILQEIEKGGPQGKAIANTRYKLANGRVVRGPQTGFIQDLDTLPIFDKTIWEEHIDIGEWYLTMASRGCPYRCTFCFNNFFAELPEENSGKYVRQRSVEHMMYELRIAKKRYKLKMIEFEDDVFTVDKKWIKKFLYEYKKDIGVQFQCLTHPKYIDEDVAGWLRDAGCEYIQMGIQTMDDQYKFKTIKRYEKSDHVERAMAVMKKYNIKPKVDHMFGLPGEPIEAQEKARKLYVDFPPFRIQTFWTNFLPGTKMIDQALEMNLVTAQEVEALNDGLGFDFYRSSSRIESPEKHRIYKAYELLFKMIPFMPPFIRKRLNPKVIARIPIPLISFLSFMADLCFGLFMRNPDHFVYARHNVYHLYKFVMKKFGVKVKGITPIIDNTSFDLNGPKVKDVEKERQEVLIEK